jgi:hypothetical protein
MVALVAVAGGCSSGTDDELAPPPTRTVTASPSQTVAPAIAAVPVGHGKVSPADLVWAQDGVLHVGARQVDLSPVDIQAFVVVTGGVFVLSAGQLWFTDLQRLRGTGQTQVTGLRTNEDASRLVVTDTRAGRPLDQGYDTGTGLAVRGAIETLTPQQRRTGPGRFVLRAGTFVEAATGSPVPLPVPAGFRPGGWIGDSVVYGVGQANGPSAQVYRCDLVARTCRGMGTTRPHSPVVFGTGK